MTLANFERSSLRTARNLDSRTFSKKTTPTNISDKTTVGYVADYSHCSTVLYCPACLGSRFAVDFNTTTVFSATHTITLIAAELLVCAGLCIFARFRWAQSAQCLPNIQLSKRNCQKRSDLYRQSFWEWILEWIWKWIWKWIFNWI